MKIRNGFVSNSSSSSFIVIGKGEFKIPVWSNKMFYFGSSGHTEFGWENRIYHTIWDKINFCYIQARDVNNQDWMDMLEKVIKKTGLTNITWDLSDNWNSLNYAYIDHQSSSREGKNTEMFESEDALTSFLFSDAYIQGGNDNA